MGKETIIVLRDGTQVKFTPKTRKFIDELKEFFSVRGIPEEDISLYLTELLRRNRAGKV